MTETQKSLGFRQGLRNHHYVGVNEHAIMSGEMMWSLCEWEKWGAFKGCQKRENLKNREVEKSREEFLEGWSVKHSLGPYG